MQVRSLPPLVLLVYIVTDIVSTDPGGEYYILSAENRSQQIAGSGDVPSWLTKRNTTTESVVVQRVDLEEVLGRLEQLTFHMEKIEHLVQNQTIELQSTIKHDIGKMYGDEPLDYQKEPPPKKDASKVGDNKEPLVFHADDTSSFRFYGDNSSLLQDFQGWCEDHQLVGFGPPKTHAWIYQSGADLGAWLKDPLPQSLSERSQIWTQTRASHVDDGYSFRRYDGYRDFRSQNRATLQTRSWWIHGVGSVVYRGLLFFHYQNHMYRLNPHTGVRRTELLSTSDYTRGQHTYVRYHADEGGLWVSYPERHRFRLVLSKLNPETLQLSRTVTLTDDISRVKGVWMVCGRVYMLFPHGTDGQQHVVRAVYDTRTGRVVQGEAREIILLYGSISQMTYNPREKVIFGWDNYHLLTWPVLWRKHV